MGCARAGPLARLRVVGPMRRRLRASRCLSSHVLGVESRGLARPTARSGRGWDVGFAAQAAQELVIESCGGVVDCKAAHPVPTDRGLGRKRRLVVPLQSS